jgi:hypothetical protein
MPVSLRLDRETEHILEKTARTLGETKSQVIKLSIRDYCSRTLEQRASRPYDLIKDLIGTAASGRGDLSMRGEEILRERLSRKK